MWKLIETWLKTLKWSKLRSIQRFSISKCSNWYNRSICTLLYINMTARNRSLCTKFILYAIILYGDQIVRRSIFMAPARGRLLHYKDVGEEQAEIKSDRPSWENSSHKDLILVDKNNMALLAPALQAMHVTLSRLTDETLSNAEIFGSKLLIILVRRWETWVMRMLMPC